MKNIILASIVMIFSCLTCGCLISADPVQVGDCDYDCFAGCPCCRGYHDDVCAEGATPSYTSEGECLCVAVDDADSGTSGNGDSDSNGGEDDTDSAECLPAVLGTLALDVERVDYFVKSGNYLFVPYWNEKPNSAMIVDVSDPENPRIESDAGNKFSYIENNIWNPGNYGVWAYDERYYVVDGQKLKTVEYDPVSKTIEIVSSSSFEHYNEMASGDGVNVYLSPREIGSRTIQAYSLHDPQTPAFRGEYNIEDMDQIEAICAYQEVVYASVYAYKKPSSFYGIAVIDFSQPTNIEQTELFDTGGAIDYMRVHDGLLFALGEDAVTEEGVLRTYSLVDPSAPILISTYQLDYQVDTFVIDGKLLYLSGNNANRSIEVLDFSVPENPTAFASWPESPWPLFADADANAVDALYFLDYTNQELTLNVLETCMQP